MVRFYLLRVKEIISPVKYNLRISMGGSHFLAVTSLFVGPVRSFWLGTGPLFKRPVIDRSKGPVDDRLFE